MRSAAVGATLVCAALLIAAGWMASVAGQGTNQQIAPGVSAFRYSAALFIALVLTVAALVTVRLQPPTIPKIGLAIGVVGGLQALFFGGVWFSLVVMPFPP